MPWPVKGLGLDAEVVISHPLRAEEVVSFVCTQTCPSELVSHRVRMMLDCASRESAPQRRPSHRHRCHLAKGDAFKARHWSRSWSSSARQQGGLQNLHSKKEMRRQQRHANWRSRCLDSGGLPGLFPDDHPATRPINAELNWAKAASDEPVPLSLRIRAGQNQIAMHERDLHAAREKHRGCPEELGAAPSQGG